MLLAQLAQERVDVRPVQVIAARRRDEVAVAAAVRAERQVDVEVADAHAALLGRGTSSPLQFGQTCSMRLRARPAERALVRADRPRPVLRERGAAALALGAHLERHQLFCPWPMLSTARNASCGTSTAPTCFIRFLPAFCFSSSLRLRVMSPP